MAFCDDPDHGWVRSTWEGETIDQRVPLTSADGIVADATVRRDR